jgi:hypothetical protein
MQKKDLDVPAKGAPLDSHGGRPTPFEPGAQPRHQRPRGDSRLGCPPPRGAGHRGGQHVRSRDNFRQ